MTWCQRLTPFILLLLICNVTGTFAQVAARYSIVISELYPDPDARAGLPAYEFIELTNTTKQPIKLRGWRIGDATGVSTINTSFELGPDSIVIICSSGAAPGFGLFGTVLTITGFPSLNNDEDVITLYGPAGNVIHSIAYTTSWYRNDIRKSGGWTLEMIDPANPCGGAGNWKASEDAKGGTPGKRNSVHAANPDHQPPALISTFSTDSVTIVAVFDESLDSSASANPGAWMLNEPSISILAARPVAPGFSEVILTLSKGMVTKKVYTLIASQQVKDCSGNTIGALNQVKTGLPSSPVPNDLVINELLFNPVGAGYDYIELYNRGKAILDLQHLVVAGRNSTGNLVNPAALSRKPRLLYPDEYVVLTTNKAWTSHHYVVKDLATIAEISGLVSMPDDKGYVGIFDQQGNAIDEVSYSAKWHFALLNSQDGVALERIDYSMPTNDKSNWTSAASAAGFGTPGYQNSQFRADLQVQGQVMADPKIFSPDNDGVDDVALIRYEMEEPGYMGSITIFDAGGRPVRFLLKSGLLGIRGSVSWDGTDEKSQKLPVGVYVVMTEIFNLKGRVKKIKNAVTLARRF